MYLNTNNPNNIWQDNPQLRALTYASKFCKDEGEEWFNKVYYAIYLVYDPMSAFRKGSSDVKELRAEVKSSFFEGEEFSKFNWNEYRTLTKEYKEKSLSKEARLFLEIEEAVEADGELLKTFRSAELEDIKRRSDAMSAYKKLTGDFKEAKKNMMDAAQNSSGSKYGGTHGNILAK